MTRPSPEPASSAPSKKRRAATAIEYVFVVSLILVGCIIGVQAVGGTLKKSTSKTSDTIEKNVGGKKLNKK